MKRRNVYRVCALLSVVIFGLILRILQWNDYLIYPDSYSYLTKSRDALVCTKIFYCTIVDLFTNIFSNPELALRVLSLVLSTASIVLVCFIFEKRRRGIGLVASLLFAVSFTICSWTNFILPDFLAIFLLLLFLSLRQSTLSVVILLFAALTRPEYVILLPVFAVTTATNKKMKILLFSFFAVATLYFIVFYGFTFGQVVLKAEPLYMLKKIIMLDPLLSTLSILGLLIFIKKPDRLGYFFAVQLVLFSIVYIYNNPLNWRYSVHLILPLVYFSTVSLEFLVDKVKRGKSIYDYFVVGVIILLIFQLYITSFGVKDNIPKYNYESFVVTRSAEVVRLAGFSPRRIGTSFSKAVEYETEVEGFDPLKEPAQPGDLIILDRALANRGYVLGDADKFKFLASFHTSMPYYFAGTMQLSGDVLLYRVR